MSNDIGNLEWWEMRDTAQLGALASYLTNNLRMCQVPELTDCIICPCPYFPFSGKGDSWPLWFTGSSTFPYATVDPGSSGGSDNSIRLIYKWMGSFGNLFGLGD
eukprot:1147280-Pelagomonas_calceolata.AAC.10